MSAPSEKKKKKRLKSQVTESVEDDEPSGLPWDTAEPTMKKRRKSKGVAAEAVEETESGLPWDKVDATPKKTKKEKHKSEKAKEVEVSNAPKKAASDSEDEVHNAGTAALTPNTAAERPTRDLGKSDGQKEGKGAKGKGKDKGKDAKGKGKGKTTETARPSALSMLKPKKHGKKYTISVAVPASIVENCQTNELKAMLVGQIARYLTIYAVNEIVVYEDNANAPQSADTEGTSRALAFFVRNLQYLETPQYLRRQLLPMHRDLRWVGLMAPLDAPHHLRRSELLPYREGVVLPADKAPEQPPSGHEGEVGCWLNCGFDQPVWAGGKDIDENVRVTLRLDKRDGDDWNQPRTGVAVSHREPTEEAGLYWGFQTRVAATLGDVFEECPYEGGYDLKIGTSERGEALGVSKLPKFKHMLMVFGGLGGLEEAVADSNSGIDGTDPAKLFSRYINLCPQQTSRTIRTEEALLIALASLSPHLPEH